MALSLRASRRPGFLARALPAFIALSLLAACATAPDPADSDAVAEYSETNDPAELTMRAIFAFNQALDTYVLKPVAGVYKDYVPDVAKRGVNNFLNNLRSPVILANDLLQGEFQRGGETTARFVMNTALGFLGFSDTAADLGLYFHNEDFGQTLAVWGVPEGPYVVLPIFGPSNPRDAVGLVVDTLADPFNWWASNTDKDWAPFARTGLRAIDDRARAYDLIEDLQRSSLDYYATIRSLYRQRRGDEIRNGAADEGVSTPGSMTGAMAEPIRTDEVSQAR